MDCRIFMWKTRRRDFGVEDALTRFWCGRRVLALSSGNDEK
jgi:hypothetical protein